MFRFGYKNREVKENIKRNLAALIVKHTVTSCPFRPLYSESHLFRPLHKQAGFWQPEKAVTYFRARCLARRFIKQQVTAAMMTIPTNKAEETPTTKGMSRRSAAGKIRGEEAVLQSGSRTLQNW